MDKEITSKLIRTFNRYSIPAIGFVVEGQLYKGGTLDSAKHELLEMWLENGWYPFVTNIETQPFEIVFICDEDEQNIKIYIYENKLFIDSLYHFHPL